MTNKCMMNRSCRVATLMKCFCTAAYHTMANQYTGVLVSRLGNFRFWVIQTAIFVWFSLNQIVKFKKAGLFSLRLSI